ncbi:hypothetical protein DUI87_16168 [Hirundo rustica rustica]|uniref:Uncharacterized protein n=1 Tax=Hirundo rustica rustica TaxID=333673 RepID=A0A3M0K5Z3_HIRRU|nr:hypothetical protein DUI87_16168 [Hirundo rustica rustica]
MGPDEIHPRILRELAIVVAKQLSMIFRKSRQSGKIMEQTFPEAMLRDVEDREGTQDSLHSLTKGKFCQVAFVSGVITAVDKGRDIICLDFYKAFDLYVPSYILSL